jgi:uncharacterized protein (TIGR03437 family)
VFASGQNQAVVQNRDGSVNSPAKPARPGDAVVAYLTGGGPVNPAGPWVTGQPSPDGVSRVTSPHAVTLGGKTAKVYYLGLAPLLVGVYQANFAVPSLTPGNYPLVVTVAGVSSNGPTVSVGE